MDKYYDLRQGLWGENKTRMLLKKYGIPQSQLKQIKRTDVYQRTKPIVQKTYKAKFAKIKGFPRRKGRDWNYQFDLYDFAGSSVYKARLNSRFVIGIIDVYSRRVWAWPVKRKTTKALMAILGPFFKANRCVNLTSDRESAIRGREFKALFKKLDIKVWHPEKFQPNDHKYATAIIERWWRTLKGLLDKARIAYQDKRVLNKLDDLVYNYNNTPHRSLKWATPMDIYTKQNSTEVQTRVVPEFKVGDTVRVRLSQRQFQKKSDPQWGTLQTISGKRGYKYQVDGRWIGPQDLYRITHGVHKKLFTTKGRDMGNLPDGIQPVRRRQANMPPPTRAVTRGMARELSNLT